MSLTLLVMAAGQGSRYGGSKQTDGMGPFGETLMEYSIYDAVQSGFNRIVFVIRESMYQAFHEQVGVKIAKRAEVAYAFQEYSTLPMFFKVPKERVKPYGTAHAVLCAKNVISDSFAVINADDFYGRKAFQVLSDSFQQHTYTPFAAMVAYSLYNTLSLYGSVTRGVCELNADETLNRIREVHQIKRFEDGVIRDCSSLNNEIVLDPNTPVSMNIWGFSPDIFPLMEEVFHNFLSGLPADDLKSECLLPNSVDQLICSGCLQVRVLHCDTEWFGVTYPDDKPVVQQKLLCLHNQSVYPERFF